ncbi:hypothetical protein BDF14DRAFT_1765673, partial [Spinellus fusiger]
AHSRSRLSRSPSRRRRSSAFSRSPSRAGQARSVSRSSRAKRDRSQSPAPVRARSRSRSPPAAKGHGVLVTHLTRNVTSDHVKEIFSQYGVIVDLDFPFNRRRKHKRRKKVG